MKTTKFLIPAVLMATAGLSSCDGSQGKKTDNPANFITDPAKVEMLQSLRDLDGIGGFYELDYTADYKLDECIEYEAVTMPKLGLFTAEKLFDEPVPESIMAKYGSGCSAFAAKTPEGDCIVGRNFDYAHPDDIAAAVIHTHPSGGYKSVCMVDAYWVGCKRNFYNDGVTDLSAIMMFPYAIMDGMNEKGFSISVLHLDGAGTMQNTGKTGIATSVAMRYLLDNAVDVADAVAKLKEFDMKVPMPNQGNYHFFLADAEGNSAVVEYVFQPGEELPNTMDVVDGARYVTNFYVSPKMAEHEYGGKSNHGRDRYDILGNALKDNGGVLTEEQAMSALSAASQPKNPEKLTSNTQWSVVYNLTDKTATVSTLRNYDRSWSFGLDQK